MRGRLASKAAKLAAAGVSYALPKLAVEAKAEAEAHTLLVDPDDDEISFRFSVLPSQSLPKLHCLHLRTPPKSTRKSLRTKPSSRIKAP